MCQGLPLKPDHLSSIPGVQFLEPIPQVIRPLQASTVQHMHAHTHAHTHKINTNVI